MPDLFSVKDKVILVTGSSRGIGAVLARGFAEKGVAVVINGRHEEAAAAMTDQLSREGLRAAGYAFDVSDEAAVEKAIDRIEREVGALDVLVNNAGLQRRARLEEMTLDQWEEVIRMDLTSAFVMARSAARRMLVRKRGKIINITSLMAEAARPTTGNYAAAKGGLKMLTRSMAAEWGPHNIQVNAIGPGYFLTDMTDALSKDKDFDAWVKARTPARRWGSPEELVGAAVFLASAASDFVNGQTIYVDGGWLASL